MDDTRELTVSDLDTGEVHNSITSLTMTSCPVGYGGSVGSLASPPVFAPAAADVDASASFGRLGASPTARWMLMSVAIYSVAMNDRVLLILERTVPGKTSRHRQGPYDTASY